MAKKYIDVSLAPIYLNSEACEQIKYMPEADVQEVKYGKWIKTDDFTTVEPIYRCSECGQIWWNSLSDYKKNVIKALPNFDAEIFRECTGIIVD